MKTHMIHRQLVFIFLLAVPVHGLAPVNPVLLQVTKQFTNYVHDHPQEKVYLHLDKKQSTPGETIWFKVYLVDADLHTETTTSSLVYVELIDPQNRIVQTRYIHASLEMAAGDFFLPVDSLLGNYTIRAYTHYMRNFDEAYFYHQAIRVWNPNDSLEYAKQEIPAVIPTDPLQQRREPPAHVLIQFFPEGGDLVNGISSKVAFKTTDQQGKSLEARTKIFDQEGKFITPALSFGRGLGLFTLRPETSKSYYAEFSFAGDSKL